MPGVPDTKPEKRDYGKPGVISSDGCEKVSVLNFFHCIFFLITGLYH